MKANKVWSVIKNVLVWIIVILAVFMMIFTVVSVTTFNRHDRDLFGYKAYIVSSDSMASCLNDACTDSCEHFDSGDLIFVKEVDPSTLQQGDIITYISQNTDDEPDSPDSYGKVITHKIREKTIDSAGQPAFITYGTKTNTDDTTLVTYPFVMGKYTGHINGVGHFFNFLKTPQGYILCIFVPFMLLIVYQGINCIRLFRRYKKEQSEALEAERAQIEADRAETVKMMEELKALRAQIQKETNQIKNNANDSQNSSDSSN